MKTEDKYTKQLITNCVLKAVRGSTTPNKPVLRFPQDKFNSSSFFSVYQNTKEKSRGCLSMANRTLAGRGRKLLHTWRWGCSRMWVCNGPTLPPCTHSCWRDPGLLPACLFLQSSCYPPSLSSLWLVLIPYLLPPPPSHKRMPLPSDLLTPWWRKSLEG